jgi:hypothetical protein
MSELRTKLGPIPDEWFENDFIDRDPKRPLPYPEDFIKEIQAKTKRSAQRTAELIQGEREK